MTAKLLPTLALLATPVAAMQGFEPATTAALDDEVTRLLWMRGASDVAVTWHQPGVDAAGCGGAGAAQQFGRARGLAAVNGFVLSNGWFEALDEDEAPGASPGGCVDLEGGIGGLDCASVDLALNAALGDMENSQDAGRVELEFTTASPTTLRVAYEFVTFENPADPAYFDGFAVLFDGVPVAGGTTHLGPEAGTDPWSLSPTTSAPAHEYQSVAPATYHAVPALSTGRRDLVIDVPAGAHALGFHVADGRAGGSGLGCGAASDQLVSSMLVVGLHEFHGGPTGVGVTSGTTLGGTRWTTVGHPVPGGRFGADFQLVLEGVDANAVVFLYSSPEPLAAPFPLAAWAPLELLLATPSFAYSELGFGSVAFPPFGPIDVPAIALGSTLVYQAFGYDLADGRVFASPGKPLVF